MRALIDLANDATRKVVLAAEDRAFVRHAHLEAFAEAVNELLVRLKFVALFLLVRNETAEHPGHAGVRLDNEQRIGVLFKLRPFVGVRSTQDDVRRRCVLLDLIFPLVLVRTSRDEDQALVDIPERVEVIRKRDSEKCLAGAGVVEEREKLQRCAKQQARTLASPQFLPYRWLDR
jgi:hypothetical protein